MSYELLPNSESPDDGPTTIRESARLFGKISSLEPRELIDRYRFDTRESAITLADQERIETDGEGYKEYYKELARHGMRDIEKAVDMLALGGSVEQRLEAVRDHRTMMALGSLASRSEIHMVSMLENTSGRGGRIEVQTDSKDKQYLRLIEEYQIGRAKEYVRSGCPFAAMNETDLPSPQYIKFALWAAENSFRLNELDAENRRRRQQ